jgi:pSer/pThr/pTyr-binding forkhead associated (FHA) protein
MEQVAITVEFGKHERRDLAVPISISSRVLAGALARALNQPNGSYMLVQRTQEGLHRLPLNASLADMGVLSGAYLVLQTGGQAEQPVDSLSAYLKLETSQQLVLEKPSLLIGRNDPRNQIEPDLDLGQVDLRKYTSRKHALITRQANEYRIEDVGSANGTFVNGKRLAMHTTQALQDGDVVEFGKADKGGVRATFHAGK